MTDQEPTKNPYTKELKKLRKQLIVIIFALGYLMAMVTVLLIVIANRF